MEDISGSFSSSTATPDARDDTDMLPAGSHGPATGNVITGAGTTSGKAGADIAAGGHVVAVRGSGGTDASDNGGTLHVEGRFGVLSLDSHGNYKYTPNAGAPDNVRDLFQYTLANAKGGRDTADLVIELGGGAVKVNANAQQIVPGPDGVITLPPGVDLTDVHVVGRDLVIDLPNGQQMVIVDGAVFVPQLVIGGVEVPASNVAELLIDSEIKPAAGTPQSSGGNFADFVPPLDPGAPLGDLIPPTEFGFPPPEVQEVDQFIHRQEPPTLIIETPDQPAGAINATESVNEKGLPPRGSESEGSGEAAAAGANGDTTETNTGTIVFSTPDGFGSVSINGTVVTDNGQTIAGQFGTITITAYNPTAGTIGYSYTLADNTSGDATQDVFAIVATDQDGDTATGSLTVHIIDDVPTARDDNGGQASQDAPVTVNVINNDTPGADSVNLGSGVALVAGSLHGTGNVVYNNNGTFTYTPGAGEEGTVTFQYRITDGDGDTSVATVTITLLPDANPTISISGDQSVNEAGLPARGAESEGSGEAAAAGANGDTSETAVGTINVNTGSDTVGSLIINGVNVTAGGTVNGAHGVLTVTLSAGVYSYSYTLTDNSSGDATNDSFSVTVTDSDGDTASTSLVISIVDDVPTAHNDSGTQASADAAVTVNVIANDVPGADSVNLTSGVALVAGSLSGSGNVVYNNNGTFTYTPTPGEEGTVTFQYRITDGDGDTSVATVTITLLADSTPTVGISGDQSVNEAGLPARAGESEGSGEAAAAGANGDTSETATGNINITTGSDTVGSLIIDGVNVTAGGTVNGTNGVLTVTLSGGVYSYSYTLSDNTSGDATSDTFAITVTDSDGDTASTSLVISIVDDVPTAHDDSGTQAGEGQAVTVNVIANDVPGADSVSLTSGVALVAGSLSGTGSVLYNNDGTFTYTPGAGEEGTVTFQYRITDGDGDTSVATVTITLAADSTPTVGVTGDQSVNEAGLPARGSESEGSGEAAAAGANGDTSETAVGSINITTGGDTLASLIINNVNVTGGGTVNGANGVLTVTFSGGVYSYSYTLSDNTSGDATSDTFSVKVTDSDGDTATTSLVISIVDDVPTAHNDSGNQLSENASVTVNVINNDVPGADSVSLTTGVALVAGSLTGTGGVIYNNDGTFTYTPGAGESGTVTFQYRITDGDGDTSVATVTINLLADSTPTVGVTGDQSVNEAGLPPRGSEPQGSGEAAAAGANGDPSETAVGNINITTGNDTLASLIINNVNVTGGGTVNGANGVLTVTFSAGVYSYSYTLSDNTIGDATSDTFSVKVTDSDGDTATTSLVISIVDDVPTAHNDTDSLAAGTFGPEGGNVISGVGTTSGAAGADVVGADNAGVISITGAGGTDTTFSSNLLSIAGTYGTLTMDALGNYNYTRNAGTPGGVTDTFSYKLQDGDGDTSSANLVITIQDSGVTDNIPPAGGATTTVYEAGLPVRGSESEGSGEAAAAGANGDTSEAVSGTIGFTAIDGLGSITIAGTVLNLAGPFPQTASTNATGTLVITGVSYNSATGVGSIAYTYTLADNTSGDATSASFSVDITDADGDHSPAGNLVINIVDDVPTAHNDSANQASENAAVTVNVVANDVFGADGVDIDNNPAVKVALVAGSLTGTGGVVYNNDGTFTYTPGAGESGTVTFQYRITDGDGDTSVATVTINLLGDSTPTIGVTGDQSVNEAGLPARGSESQGSGEAAAAGVNGDTSETAVGNINITTGNDTVQSLIINNVNVTGGGTVAGASGTLTVTFSGGVYSYSYTLTDNTSGDATTDTFALKVTDSDGDTATTSLVISIVDDTPTLGPIQNQQTDNLAADNDPTLKDATGTLHFVPGADSPGSTMTITADMTGITSGGKAIVTHQVGNVLTGYQDVGPAGYDAGDTTVVFTLTINPTAGTSGQYVFDLVTPLDPTVTPVDIGQGSSFGAGPTDSIIVSDPVAGNLVFVTGWSGAGAGGFTLAEQALWLAGNEPDWAQESDVNGSTQGWGRGNNNFDAGEILRFDFGTLDDYDNQQLPNGPYTPPAATIVDVSFATFTFFNMGSGDNIDFVAHYTDGTTQSFTLVDGKLNGAGNVLTSLTITAPAGTTIAWIDTFEQTGSIKLNLATVGVNSTTIDETIPFTLQMSDGDGDLTSTQNFSIHIATGLSPDAPVAPVVLDLNGDGVHFLGSDAGVHYDYGNGSVATAWAAPDDGILVRDANHNGTVDNASEFVFGSGSITDLAALASYDTNHDGMLSAADADFGSFAVWQDANSNGVVDAGEMMSLTARGITSISLSSDGIAYSAASGDVEVAGTGSFTYANGSTGSLADAAFATGNRGELAKSTQGNEANATILAAALAAAGLASQSAAASNGHADGDGATHSSGVAGVHNEALAPIALNTVGASSSQLPEQGSAGVEKAVEAQGSTQASDEGQANAAVDTAPKAPLTELLQGTDAPVHNEVVAQTPVTAAAVGMPAPTVAAGAAHSGPVQGNEVVAEVLADALHSGGGGTIDALINSLPNHGGAQATEALASLAAGGVSNGDTGVLGGFSGAHLALTMEAMVVHQDAVPAHA